MTEITFALIRKRNPHLDFDRIEDISTIHLSNCSIDHISNLELFSHINHLDLAHNKISNVQELQFLNKLETLDLSFNLISADNLKTCLKEFPKGLKSLNLTGNSCILDEDNLIELQDLYPDLGIIIDTVDINDDGVSPSTQEESSQELFSEQIEKFDNNRPLNADSLLKSIVARKCKLQNMSTFNLDKTMSV